MLRHTSRSAVMLGVGPVIVLGTTLLVSAVVGTAEGESAGACTDRCAVAEVLAAVGLPAADSPGNAVEDDASFDYTFIFPEEPVAPAVITAHARPAAP